MIEKTPTPHHRKNAALAIQVGCEQPQKVIIGYRDIFDQDDGIFIESKVNAWIKLKPLCPSSQKWASLKSVAILWMEGCLYPSVEIQTNDDCLVTVPTVSHQDLQRILLEILGLRVTNELLEAVRNPQDV